MRHLLLYLLLLFAACVQAQQEVTIIPLHHRSVEQILPALEPLVESGGSLSGMHDQLFIRTTPRNLEQLRRVLTALDVPARRLAIQVSLARAGDETQRGGRADGQLVIGNGARASVNARFREQQTTRSSSAQLMVQTIEGGRAWIQVGTALPLAMRQITRGPRGVVVSESVVYRDIGQGFYARPRLHGDQVTLDISLQDDEFRSGPETGRVNVERLASSVTGRLGEWIELGGVSRQEQSRESMLLGGSGSTQGEQRALWLRVEEVR